MEIKINRPRTSLNKAFLKVKPSRERIDDFKKHLIKLLDLINEDESEEYNKNLIRDFLKDIYYSPDYFINTKYRTDLVIHKAKNADSPTCVILEAKRPTNRTEMVKKDNINAKAFHELILYYLRERICNNNLEIKYLIATNIYEWFIFDARIFDRYFAQNKSLVNKFLDFENGSLVETKTDFFYNNIAKPFVEHYVSEIDFTYFDFRDYEKRLRNSDKKDDRSLIPLFKILSPEHLLKLPFANDSNSLDKNFYAELLHILGLSEAEVSGKKIIRRCVGNKQNPGSLLEQTITQLESHDKISMLNNPKQYGKDEQERLFNVGLDLCITWLNRILFMKLLEAQLIAYHNDRQYEFMNIDRIYDFDTLDKLFFQVLAIKPNERKEQIRKEFTSIPYLNSSLFEPTSLEHDMLFISSLNNDISIPIYSHTVLKDQQGRKRSGTRNTLDYLFEFLNSYDFSSEGSEDIQEDNKTLINASVLGLIFEKINGYKEGSFFTPGFITMFMSKETIRKAVIQKFNDIKGWNCSCITDVYNEIEDRSEANQIINSMKICDPSVGSGHFLVSTLNELIAIKSDLKILQDSEGKRLKEYKVEVSNDELVVTDEEGKLFRYNPRSSESQRVQETLFNEKRTIIENCLFGVDINPNSVKICQLRLWIELLKNAYYKNESELETLPNIDINIKCGNSLVSRYALNANLKPILKKSPGNWDLDSYRHAVNTYKNAKSKEEKREMASLIGDIKHNFKVEIAKTDKDFIRYVNKKGELYYEKNQQRFGQTKKQIALHEKKVADLTKEVALLEDKLEEIRKNVIYTNAFEWRFEFPEVLDQEGNYAGFDVVIGNPPYMRVQEIQATQPKQKVYYEQHYQNATGSYDLANIFFELAVNISSKHCKNAYIFPHKFLNSDSASTFRNYLRKGCYIDEIAHFGANMIFGDADTYTCIVQFSKEKNQGFDFQRFHYKSDFKQLMVDKAHYTHITYEMIDTASKLYGKDQWVLFDNEIGFKVFESIYKNTKTFADTFEGIFQGIATSKDDLYILECLDNTSFRLKVPISDKVYNLEKDLFKPFLMGRDVKRYSHLQTNRYVFFPYKIVDGQAEIVTLEEVKTQYPHTYEYVMDHEAIFKSRESGRAGRLSNWYAYIYPKNLNKFEQPKLSSMEICANHPNVTYDVDNLYHTTKVYSWVKREDCQESYEYLLAIANSKLLWWFLKCTGDTLQGDARTFKTNYLNPFPLPLSVDPNVEEKIANKVRSVLEWKMQNDAVDTKSVEDEIDEMVYDLYDLKPEEREYIKDSI